MVFTCWYTLGADAGFQDLRCSDQMFTRATPVLLETLPLINLTLLSVILHHVVRANTLGT
jgi:hypothetical protein